VHRAVCGELQRQHRLDGGCRASLLRALHTRCAAGHATGHAAAVERSRVGTSSMRWAQTSTCPRHQREEEEKSSCIQAHAYFTAWRRRAVAAAWRCARRRRVPSPETAALIASGTCACASAPEQLRRLCIAAAQEIEAAEPRMLRQWRRAGGAATQVRTRGSSCRVRSSRGMLLNVSW
jgi:hypothetical protein